METLSFQAPTEVKKQLEMFAKKLDRSKAYLIRQALEEYFEDLKDYLEAKRYKASYDSSENFTMDEIKRKYKIK